jgi:Flp pilus assembly protein TadG
MRSALLNFRTERSGNVAILFGILAVPLFAAAGMALDYAFAVRERIDLQNAVDAAAISLAKLPQNTSAADLKTKAEAFVAAYMPNSAANDFKIDVVPSKGRLDITATANYPTTVVRVLDLISSDASHSNMEIGASATASWGNGKVEVVLVLDNTGSMAGTKLTNLKTAANSLVDTLATQATDASTVKIALVPFSSTVRLPVDKTDYKTASWIDKNGASPIAKEIFNGTANVKRFDLFSKIDAKVTQSVTWAGCVESRPDPYDVTDPAPSTSTPGTLIVPYFAPDEPDSTHLDGRNNTVADFPNNYVADGVAASKPWKEKQGATAKYDTKPSQTIGANYGPNLGCDMQPIVPMSSDLTKNGVIKTGIKNMNATGNTNIPMGLAWGWYALSPNDMLSNNAPYSDDETGKVIVLMTDGDNTISNPGDTYNKNGSAYAGVGYIWQNRVGVSATNASDAARQTALDNRLKQLCTNIKAVMKKPGSTTTAIEIYTVLVELDSKATSKLLSDCATTPDMFYNVANSANLLSVFNNIAGSISKLHLSK